MIRRLNEATMLPMDSKVALLIEVSFSLERRYFYLAAL